MSIEILHKQFSSRLQIVFKISERCNLACSYCYFFFRGDESYKTHPPIVPEDVVSGLIAFMRDAHENHSVERIDIVLHGGEPLLMKKRRFSAMMDRLQDETPDSLEIRFAMQTNAALIDGDWIDIFAKHQIGVGVSFDGPKEIHDEFRIDHKGRGSYDDCRAGWDKLREASDQGRLPPPGLLGVINHKRDAKEIFNHFVHDLQATVLNFLLPDLHHDDNISQEEIDGTARYLIDVFHAWLENKNNKVSIRFISEVYSPLLSDFIMDESVTYKEDYRCILTVASNGEIRTEDTVTTLDERFRNGLLNVRTHTLSDVVACDWWRELSEASAIRPKQCVDCAWWSVCKSGKPYNRFSKARGFDNHSVFCSALKDYYVEVAAHLVKLGFSLDEILERLEKAEAHQHSSTRADAPCEPVLDGTPS